ncbi:MAG: hypothetical protein FWC09_08750 [Lachnospiraceae bacterium]|nr:hypothetical protein [Lachnospiraceae bacterium]
MKTGLKERDIKLLLLLLLVIIIALPFYFMIRPGIEEMEKMRNEISALNTEKSRLEAFVVQIPAYNEAITSYTVNIDRLLRKYPNSLYQEASLLFIDAVENNIPMMLQTVSFSEVLYQEISPLPEEAALEDVTAESGEYVLNIGDDLNGIINHMNFTYFVGYNEFKEFLTMVKNNNERLVISRITAAFNAEAQLITGDFTMTSYGIYSSKRPPVITNSPALELGTANIFEGGEGVAAQEDVRPDIFVRALPVGLGSHTVSVGRSNDMSGLTYIGSELNDVSEVTITLTGEFGEYTAAYSVNDTEYTGEPVVITKKGNLNIEIFSSRRSGADDNVGVVLTVVNETDTYVNVKVFSDDDDSPRVIIDSWGDVRY